MNCILDGPARLCCWVSGCMPRIPWGNLAHVLAQTSLLFAGGCFWGTELAFQRVPGVVKTAVGYTQGQQKNPSYDSVCGGRTGHTEGVLVGLQSHSCSL